MTTTSQNNLLIILILGALTTISPLSIDMYLPTFNQIAEEMNTSVAKVSLSVSSYFVGLGIGQIFYGPFLDRFGRKKPVYAGLTIYVLATIGCILSTNVTALIAFRFLQALGGCAAQVAATSMVHDFFPEKDRAKVFSLLMLILGVAPLLAPTIGGFIVLHLGWHWVFIILAAIATTICAVMSWRLPEGHQPDHSVSLKPGPILRTFGSIIKVREFHTYALAGACSFAGLFAYVAGSPIIFMDVFKVSPQVYGGIFALLATGFIGGSQLNIQLLKKYKGAQIFQAMVSIQVCACLLFLVGVMNGWLGLPGTVAMLFVILGCAGTAYPNAAVIALAPFNKNAGSASALLGFLQTTLAALVSSGIGLFDSGGLMPIVTLLAASSGLGLTILLAGTRLEKPAPTAGSEAL